MTAPAEPLVLWTRSNTRGRWRVVARVPDMKSALDLMRAGDYAVLPVGKDPNRPAGCGEERRDDDD